MDIVAAFEQVGTFRGAAVLCGTTHKTVKRVMEARDRGELDVERAPRTVERNTDCVAGLIAQRVRATDGRISAKRLLPRARAAGYTGSARNFRRAVAEAKARWRRQRRVYRPWVAQPGEHLVIDWTTESGWQVFCAVLPWSRWRFVRFARDQRAETTMGLLAECFEAMGGVPAVVLADRMGCLKGGVVANVVVPTAAYVRFATHFGFRPDFCEAADPESKGVVEALAGYVQRDLIVPSDVWENQAEANAAAGSWCEEINGRVHSEIAAVPAERLVAERQTLRPLPNLRPPLRRGEMRRVDKLATVRFGSARYSVPRELVGGRVEVAAGDGRVEIFDRGVLVAEHPLVAPGEVSIVDDHYGGPRRQPTRAIRPRTGAERAFLALGPAAEAFLRAAAASGTSKLGTELAAIVDLEPAWGRDALVAAIERATTFRRFKASDVRAILEAGPGVPAAATPGEALIVDLPTAPVRPLSAYRIEELA
jgi:transposase